MRGHGLSAPFALGALNGLLPCGLVYGAVTAAMALGRPWDGALFITMFGIGTTPTLALIWMASSAMPAPIRARLRLAAPCALAITGLLLIARGGACRTSSTETPITPTCTPRNNVLQHPNLKVGPTNPDSRYAV
jgi:sulfite exporter TauE/SafE